VNGFDAETGAYILGSMGPVVIEVRCRRCGALLGGVEDWSEDGESRYVFHQTRRGKKQPFPHPRERGPGAVHGHKFGRVDYPQLTDGFPLSCAGHRLGATGREQREFPFSLLEKPLRMWRAEGRRHAPVKWDPLGD
jgi:hypothetical protein